MSTRGLHPNEFEHDLDHHGQASFATLGSAHAGGAEFGEKSTSDMLDEFEHHLFHAVSILYFLASSTPGFLWDDSIQILAPGSSATNLTVIELEPPFRPPRSPAFI